MPSVPSSTSSQEVQSLKNEIHSLETNLQASRNRQDCWNAWYLRLGVLALITATLLGIVSWVCQKKASAIEFASRPDTSKLADKNARLREVLDQEANIKLEGVRLAVAEANQGAAQANQRAAEATKAAENERTERLKLEVQIDPRRLSPKQQMDIVTALTAEYKKYPLVEVRSYATDVEGAILADQIVKVLSRAIIHCRSRISSDTPMGPGSIRIGVAIEGTDTATVEKLRSVFSVQGGLVLAAPKQKGMQGVTQTLSMSDDTPTSVTILVGAKPLKE